MIHWCDSSTECSERIVFLDGQSNIHISFFHPIPLIYSWRTLGQIIVWRYWSLWECDIMVWGDVDVHVCHMDLCSCLGYLVCLYLCLRGIFEHPGHLRTRLFLNGPWEVLMSAKCKRAAARTHFFTGLYLQQNNLSSPHLQSWACIIISALI